MSRSGSLTDVLTETRTLGVLGPPFTLAGDAAGVAFGAAETVRLDGGFGRDLGGTDDLRVDGAGGIVAGGDG